MTDFTDPEYAEDNVQITVDGRRFDGGVLGIAEGEVVLLEGGDGPALQRIIMTARASEVTATRPRSGIGMGMVLKLTMHGKTVTVSPQTVANSAFVTPKKIKRARSAVEAFESALAATQATDRADAT